MTKTPEQEQNLQAMQNRLIADACLHQENVELRQRCRFACQTLIATIGSDGPENVEEAATRTVAYIATLRERVRNLKRKRKKLNEQLEISRDEPLCTWVLEGKTWCLRVQGRNTSAAIVYDNAVWHTFDCDGVGGENSVELSVPIAKREAAASAIAQGFI